jgi:DNA-binding transcriptional MerR regulator
MTMAKTSQGRRVGELASASGLTVRTLHYYEEIGLLPASARTSAGHRLYSDDDVQRLYRVCLLRRLGLPLDEIGRALDDPAWSLQGAMAAHLSDLDRRLAAMGRLRGRVGRLMQSTQPTEGPHAAQLLKVMEDMTMLDSAPQRRVALLVYRDLEAAFDFLVRVFGLGPGQLTRDDDGSVVHGEIQAGDGVIWLHPELAEMSLSSPQTVGASTSCMAVMVDDVDVHYRHAAGHGAVIEYEPVDQPYGYREYSVRDCEGHLWSFMKPLE